MPQATTETPVTTPTADDDGVVPIPTPAPLPTMPPVAAAPVAPPQPEPVAEQVATPDFVPLSDARLMELAAQDDPQAQEIWEGTTDANIFVNVFDLINPNQRGGWKLQRVGVGAKRIQISVYERRYNQSMVPEENISLDPFSNGQLRCVIGSTQSPNAYTDEQLIDFLRIEPESAFEDMVNAQDSEIVLRRLLALSERYSHVGRFNVIRDVIDDRYKVGKRQRVIEEYDNEERQRSASRR